jgi:hypothetical protein
VSISGNFIVVGAYAESSHRGAIYVFVWDGEKWTQEHITSPDPGDFYYFGQAVSISGNRIVVGEEIGGISNAGVSKLQTVGI